MVNGYEERLKRYIRGQPELKWREARHRVQLKTDVEVQ